MHIAIIAHIIQELMIISTSKSLILYTFIYRVHIGGKKIN